MIFPFGTSVASVQDLATLRSPAAQEHRDNAIEKQRTEKSQRTKTARDQKNVVDSQREWAGAQLSMEPIKCKDLGGCCKCAGAHAATHERYAVCLWERGGPISIA